MSGLVIVSNLASQIAQANSARLFVIFFALEPERSERETISQAKERAHRSHQCLLSPYLITLHYLTGRNKKKNNHQRKNNHQMPGNDTDIARKAFPVVKLRRI